MASISACRSTAGAAFATATGAATGAAATSATTGATTTTGATRAAGAAATATGATATAAIGCPASIALSPENDVSTVRRKAECVSAMVCR